MKAPRFSLALLLLLAAPVAMAMPDGGALEGLISYLISTVGTWGTYALVAVEIGYSVYAAQDAKRKAKNAYNDSLTDRTITARGATEPRQMVLGRQRVGGTVVFIASTGPNKEKMVMVIALAAHECDAIEEIYFNDQQVDFADPDNATFVTTEPYQQVANVSFSDPFDGDGLTVTFTLTNTPIAGTVSGSQTTGNGQDSNSVSFAVAAVSGTTVTLGVAPLGAFSINYQSTVGTSHATVRTFLGAPGQTVDAGLQAMFPPTTDMPHGWDYTHKMSGCAGLVVILDYNEDAFQSEVQVSAVMRGAKCYDPRLDSTAGGSGTQRVDDSTTWTWSENPAVLIAYAAMSPLCGRQPDSAIRWADVAAAANVCDQPVDYATWALATDETGLILTDESGNPFLI